MTGILILTKKENIFAVRVAADTEETSTIFKVFDSPEEDLNFSEKPE